MMPYQKIKIETIRLNLCYPTDYDFSVLAYLWRNKKVREFLGGTLNDEAIHQKILNIKTHWEQYQFGLLVVHEKLSNQILGLCGLHHSDEGVELSYMFFPQFWGKGFASEAAKACIHYGFNIHSIKRIVAITQSENVNSCVMLKKIGMIQISTFERFHCSQSLFEFKEN